MNLITPRTRIREVMHELDGGIAGYERDHWDDRVDAKVLTRGARVHIPEHGLALNPHGLLLPREREPEVLRHHGREFRLIQGAAWGNGGLYLTNWIDILDATQLAIDTSLTTHKWAMFDNSITNNFSTDVSFNTTGQVSGTGYTSGGQTILSPTTTESPSGTLMYDMADQVWAAPTTVTAYGAKLYADALAGDNLIVAMPFGGAFTSTAGTFTIQFASTGVFTIDLTP